MITKELLSKYADKYKSLFDTEGQFSELLEQPDLKKRKEIWEAIVAKTPNKKELSQYANPFFVGYGKHDSKILFIGKEKAIKVEDSPEILLFESVNNLLHWQKILNDEEVDELHKEKKFHPAKPNEYHGDPDGRHTWSKYARIAHAIDPTIENNVTSLFANCFCTELNYQPSPSSRGFDYVKHQSNYKARIDFLKEFVGQSNFKMIIIGANTYFKGKREEKLSKIFGSIEVYTKADYVDRHILPFEHYKTKDGKRSILITYQLSGGASWSNKGLEGIGKRMNM